MIDANTRALAYVLRQWHEAQSAESQVQTNEARFHAWCRDTVFPQSINRHIEEIGHGS